ncbi:uncharacterized protein PRCAT00003146001 [Priceomyces carsonii]|uniref:uncharacterized protein n=1 Tax=Priceomyces carsonii TaxID=28549 RepID=UPI002ED80601|nr:unnamed protein product [Priceomyces carsonii]
MGIEVELHLFDSSLLKTGLLMNLYLTSALRLSSFHVTYRLLPKTLPKYSPILKQCKNKFSTTSIIFNQQRKLQNSLEKKSDERNPLLESADKPNPIIKSLSNRIYTIPNALTLTRIASTPFIGYFIAKHEPNIAISIFVYSCITDLLDGFIARKFNQGSILGSILDPMADKFLMTVCTISLTYIQAIPLPVAGIIIGRDVMLSFMAFYYRYITLDEPKSLKRFVDLSIPSASVRPNLLSKYNTALQMVYIGSLVLRPVIESILNFSQFPMFVSGLETLVCITTVLSGLSYIFSKKAIIYLKNTPRN